MVDYYTETMSSAGYHSHDTLQAVPHQRKITTYYVFYD
jgi:hypothetical protein